MDKFQSERIENLKVQFYTVVGRLEVEKNIIISYDNLQIFEKNIFKCKSESEAAGCVLGAIRRYTAMLDHLPENSYREVVVQASNVTTIHNGISNKCLTSTFGIVRDAGWFAMFIMQCLKSFHIISNLLCMVLEACKFHLICVFIPKLI